MLRALIRSMTVVILAGGGVVAVLIYHEHFSASRQIEKLQEEKTQLQRVVQKLESEKRVADVLVSRREMIDGVPNTTLLFVEYDRQGKPLPARTFCVQGDLVHIDAMVIKFEHDFVKSNDPLRGHSVALFTKIYGDRQSSQSAAVIDEPNSIP